MTRRRASSAATPLAPSRSAPWLGVTGVLMLLVGFALFNGWFGFEAERWPWEVWTDAGQDLRAKTVLVLWFATGLWCAALGFATAQRVRAIGCGVLGAVLLSAALGDGHAVLAALSGGHALLLVAASGLGAGLLLAREPRAGGRGRLLAGIGGALCLWLLALPASGSGTSVLGSALEELRALFGEDAPGVARVLGSSAPRTLMGIAALGGILAGLGLLGRRILLIWFFVLLGAWLLRTGTPAIVDEHAGGLGGGLVSTAVLHGLVLWLFALFTLRDLAVAAGGEA